MSRQERQIKLFTSIAFTKDLEAIEKSLPDGAKFNYIWFARRFDINDKTTNPKGQRIPKGILPKVNVINNQLQCAMKSAEKNLGETIDSLFIIDWSLFSKHLEMRMTVNEKLGQVFSSQGNQPISQDAKSEFLDEVRELRNKLDFFNVDRREYFRRWELYSVDLQPWVKESRITASDYWFESKLGKFR